jgi:ribosomal protein L7/L12
MLYWVAVVEEPTKKQKEEDGKEETIIMQPKITSAKDDKMAAIKIVREAEELKGMDLNRVQVIVRPF